MHRIALNKIVLRPSRFAELPRLAHRALFGLFVIQLALVVAGLWPRFRLWGEEARWPDGLLLLLAGATMVAGLGMQLPGQNVILAALGIAFIAGGVQTIGALTAIPFGPFVYTERMGQELFHPLPWSAPVLWIVVLLASRGVARLCLRPWRKTRTYGFRLIGLTAFFAVLFDFGLEPWATAVRHFWIWKPTKIPLAWYGAPCVNFVGWALTALLILAFVTPALINKKPVKQHPPDYHPLVVWVLLNLLLLAGAATSGLWAAAVVVLAETVVAGVFAVRGGRW
jgi:uncharacterized membrane protein